MVMTVLASLAAWWLLALVALAGFNLALVRFIQSLVPPVGRFVEIGPTRLHIVDSGERPGRREPALLFIHGLLGELNHFAFDLAARFPERRVVLVDRPGSGYSARLSQPTLAAQADVIADLIEALGLHRPVIVGHSLGGAVALATALDHGGRISGLALIAPLTQRVARPPGAFASLAGRSRFSLWFGAWTLGPLVTLARAGVARDQIFAPDPVPAQFWNKGGGLLSARPGALLAAAADMAAPSRELPAMSQRYGALRLPIGVLFGNGDRLLDPKVQGDEFCAAAPEARLTRIAGGHMLPVTHPAETEVFIRGVLARVGEGE
jgi:pimeloyl-ACP methyl ester carboxylesterase